MSLHTRLEADEIEARVALAGLRSMSPHRLRTLLGHHCGVELLDRLRTGASLHPELERNQAALHSLRAQVGDSLLGSADLKARGMWAVVRGGPGYPDLLGDDPEAPEVLFGRGDLDLLTARRVGIVGTRNATAAGRATSCQLGAELASAGVAVISGLARGIDVSAHRGVRDGGARSAVAVVGSGLDVCYPKQNRLMWEWVGEHGLLLSEWPPGAQPEGWHFPLRNRIIAALSEVIVVVESRESGGSLLTVDAALTRGIDVMAVPGSTHCRAAAGTNMLLAEGAGVVCSTDDVLGVLDLTRCRRHPLPFTDAHQEVAAEQLCLPLDEAARTSHHDRVAASIIETCREVPTTIDQLVGRTGSSVTEVALAVTALERRGLVRAVNGWVEATGSRLDHFEGEALTA